MMYSEKLVSFGPSGGLHGILTEPKGRAVEGAPAVLTWNVGLHHHVGPHRVFVDLSRALASAGFTCLRFDVSGLGDSALSRDDARPDNERAISDVQAAMKALRAQRGFETFVPVGFCSSVDAAHAIGVADSSVAGVVYLEGWGIRTPGFYLHYPKRFLNRNRWERLLKVKYPWLFGASGSMIDPEERERIYVRVYPSQAQLSADVRAMTRRGARLLLVYVGGDTDYGYREQFYEMIGDTPAGTEVVYYPDADHTFFIEQDRKTVVQRVTRWMSENFGLPREEQPRDVAFSAEGHAK